MSVPQRAQTGKPPSNKITRQDVADLLKQIRALMDAFERRLQQVPAAPSPSATRSQLPRRSFKSAPRRNASARPRAFGQGPRQSSSPGCCAGCYADNCAGAGNCTCACHGGR